MPSRSRRSQRQLLVIDATPIRQKAQKEYLKARRDLERAQGQLDRFRQRDEPEFSRWVNATFGALFTQLREVNREFQSRRQLVVEVEFLHVELGMPYPQAYAEAMYRREHPEEAAAWTREDPLEDDFEDRPDSGEENPSEEDPFDDAFKKFFEELEDWANGTGPEPQGGGFGEDPRNGKAAAHRLKSLYRALARKLHPDTQTEMTPRKLQWWHQAQAAYEAKDGDQLELILTLCEVEERGTGAVSSVSVLQRMTSQVKQSLRELRRELSKCRKQPAWSFTLSADHTALAQHTSAALSLELLHLRHELAWVERQIQDWARLAAKHAQPRAAKPPRERRRPPEPGPPHPEFEFF